MLLEQLHDENLKVSWTQNSVELQKMFDIISTYHNKLVNIKKDMRMLHDKNIKLKKRALRLQQHKEKLDHLQNQQKEIDLKREQELIGKSSSKPSWTLLILIQYKLFTYILVNNGTFLTHCGDCYAIKKLYKFVSLVNNFPLCCLLTWWFTLIITT